MSMSHFHYLRELPDEQQYPPALCESAEVCMYGKSASSGFELMNRANDSIRRRMAIDIVSALVLLVKKECKCFQ